jgi:hypothetical protein
MASEVQLQALQQLYAVYDALRKQLGVSERNAALWHAEGSDRIYQAVADGMGGATAIVLKGDSAEGELLFNEPFASEAEAIEAIRCKAVADNVIEDEDQDDS